MEDIKNVEETIINESIVDGSEREAMTNTDVTEEATNDIEVSNDDEKSTPSLSVADVPKESAYHLNIKRGGKTTEDDSNALGDLDYQHKLGF